jgi:phage terminase large subunit
VNPSGHPWARTEIEDKQDERGNVHVDVSTYHDNPYLPQSIRDEIEALKFTDKDLYSIYAKGAWTELKGVIFKDFQIVKELPTKGKIFWGMDFGYNDSLVLVKVVLVDKSIYIKQYIHQSRLLLDEMADIMKTLKIHVVYCDSAEPRTIKELRLRGINARPAKKGKDSVINGITFMKQHKIYITSNSLETISNFRRYKWDTDKDGNLLDAPNHDGSDGPDAVRYALSRALGGRISVVR